MSGQEYTGDEDDHTPAEQLGLRILDNTIYEHKVLCINFTSYDMRRDQDSINPRNHADVMVLAHEDEDAVDSHPYWYAHIVMIISAHIGTPDRPHRIPMRFFYVRWFERDTKAARGWETHRLDRLH